MKLYLVLEVQVAEQGCVHLGGLLKVTAEYNSKGDEYFDNKEEPH